ncbi:MAG TPA: hypothetical protein VHG52_09635, partial [Thermomicrobiales bacterium]|nr:hypothetical protein [Thermomicrobiales bacterium]
MSAQTNTDETDVDLVEDAEESTPEAPEDLEQTEEHEPDTPDANDSSVEAIVTQRPANVPAAVWAAKTQPSPLAGAEKRAAATEDAILGPPAALAPAPDTAHVVPTFVTETSTAATTTEVLPASLITPVTPRSMLA